jgi:4,5-dihydroxyphthalate decarboxylase
MAASLTVSVIPSAITGPVLSGQVPIEGAETQLLEASSVNANSLKMLDHAFDVAEMSLATFVKARDAGFPLIAVPVFPGRAFPHQAVTVSTKSGIRDLSELRGKRVGLPQFWMTSSVWHRLVLRQVYGVAQEEVHWVTVAPERMGSLGYPQGVDVRQDTSGRNQQELLLAGDVDASMAAGGAARGPRKALPEGIAPAFPDLQAAQRDYFQKTGILPLIHLIVMKEELAKSQPELVASICNAFQRAKETSLSQALQDPELVPLSGASPSEVTGLLGADPWVYGIDANRKVLALFLKDAHDQQLTTRELGVDELFAPDVPAAFR